MRRTGNMLMNGDVVRHKENKDLRYRIVKIDREAQTAEVKPLSKLSGLPTSTFKLLDLYAGD